MNNAKRRNAFDMIVKLKSEEAAYYEFLKTYYKNSHASPTNRSIYKCMYASTYIMRKHASNKQQLSLCEAYT